MQLMETPSTFEPFCGLCGTYRPYVGSCSDPKRPRLCPVCDAGPAHGTDSAEVLPGEVDAPRAVDPPAAA